MEVASHFHRVILDSVPHHVAVINSEGTIVFVNQAWIEFAQLHQQKHEWVGYSYWDVCNQDQTVVSALTKMLQKQADSYGYQYHYHTGQQQRWYQMSAIAIDYHGQRFAVITHVDITEQKNAEEEVRELTLLDSLTALPNRRHFTQFFDQEWRRGIRQQQPLSVLLLDVDLFKQYNDTYGHQMGDQCLQRIAALLAQFAKRPGDLMARYGGEEFVLVLANTDTSAAEKIANKLVNAVLELKIPHIAIGIESVVTISIGVATLVPSQQLAATELLQRADKALYQVKKHGRNGFKLAQ
ncbi:GGDEF domain-containing protein [Ferrimonas lipolytica]|uniref:diguanylate cyclase n=1 Tax=Ferrimonas lipolytica TaxID=2724191 RepID=A0A6H1UE51_9GAMM|nr:GGDEF domain-containing protein [Ferrimonas lipolytica]QIZ77108.1 diguanylate cyclase [Ferrimonas lipolytica]